jgi:hypothetical protein
MDTNEIAGYNSFTGHATALSAEQREASGICRPGVVHKYVSVRAGFILGGLLAYGGENEMTLMTYINTWRAQERVSWARLPQPYLG